jgi:hypothetical protein
MWTSPPPQETMMYLPHRAILLLIAFALGWPALAQEGDEPSEIVVEGKRPSRSATEAFVRELTPSPLGGQLGRFLDPVCPVVVGMSEADKGLVENRMRRVAAAVQVPVAPQRCAPNIYVVLGRDKREIIDGLRNQFPGLVEGVPRPLMKRLIHGPEPVAAWQTVDVIGSDGMPLASARMSADGDPVRIARTVGTPSRIEAKTKPYFVASVLVIEGKALRGVTTRQLADYAAMRTLAPTDTTRESKLPAPSILSLFNPDAAPDAAPQSVTWWDVKFLKSLYAFDNAVSASAQRSSMSRYMAKELSKVRPEQ